MARAVLAHSVLSLRASTFSQRAVFFSRFSLREAFMLLTNSALALKNASQVLRKRSKIFVFIFLGVNPIVFHSACRAFISSDILSHSA